MILQKMFNEAMAYQTSLVKYEDHVVDKVLSMLQLADVAMTKKLTDYIGGSGKGIFTAKWLQGVTAEIKTLVHAGGQKTYDDLVKELTELSKIVVEKELKILEAGMGPGPMAGTNSAKKLAGDLQWSSDGVAHYNFMKPSVDQLVAISETTPIQGQLLKKWFDKITTDKQDLIQKNIKLGMVEGDTIEKMVQRIAGTKANNYKDGVLEVSRRHAEAIARTAVNNVSNQATHLTYQANADIIKGWTFLATLDSRTTITCASLSGTKWPIGSGPVPPRHVRCRSFQLPDMKTWKELGVPLDEMPESVRASKDGPVKSDITFQEWLKGQPPQVRHEILGTERMKLFDAGELDITQFTNKRGQVYSLETLKAKYPSAMEDVHVKPTKGKVLAGQKDAPYYEDFKAPDWDGAKLVKLDSIKGAEKVGGPIPDVSNLIPEEPTTKYLKDGFDLSALKTSYSDTHIKNILPKINELADAYDNGGVDLVKEVAGQYKSIYLSGLKKSLDMVGIPADMMAAIDEVLAAGKLVDKTNAAAKKAQVIAQKLADNIVAAETAGTGAIPTPHISQFQKIAGKLGSNEGGTYRNLLTGENWYIKTPASIDMAQNEIVASKLYRLAGAEVTELEFIDMGSGQWAVGSKWRDGLEIAPQLLKSGTLDGVYEWFGTDAWLANWDVVGMDYDNLKVFNGIRGVRVDPGGSLFYRAQGGLKGKEFGSYVQEIKTFFDFGLNPRSAEVFKGISEREIRASVARVLNISEADIRDTVNKAGILWPQSKRDELIEILLARQKNLQEQFPELVKAVPPKPVGRITPEDVKAIYEGRSNGYAIRVDYDQIEDQQILWHVEKHKNGADTIIGTFKVRGEGADILDAIVSTKTKKEYTIEGLTQTDADGLYDKLLVLVKGLGANPNVRAVDLERAVAARDALIKLQKISDPSFKAYTKDWYDIVRGVINTAEGQPHHLTFTGSELKRFEVPFTITSPTNTSNIQFFKKPGTFSTSDIKKGFIQKNGLEESLQVGADNSFYEADIGGVKVRYWSKSSDDVTYSLKARVQLVTDGADHIAIEKALKALDDLGINAKAVAPLQAEEMYLQKIAYHQNWDDYTDKVKSLTGLTTEEKVSKWKSYIQNKIGEDVTKLPGYNPDGTRTDYWKNGDLHFLNPLMRGKDWEKFTKDFSLTHDLTYGGGTYTDKLDRILDSGGNMISGIDRVRRGIRWGNTSPDSDFISGGAASVYTRIVPSSNGSVGIYWKPDNVLRRMDGISYAGDAYGQVAPVAPRAFGVRGKVEHGENAFVIANRTTPTVSELKSIAGRSGNETIFKGSLSIFTDIDKIVVPHSEYNSVIAVFKKHGFNKWPDGRNLEDVIKRPS